MAVVLSQGDIDVRNSVFTNNTSMKDGAVFSFISDAKFHNSSFVDNMCTGVCR